MADDTTTDAPIKAGADDRAAEIEAAIVALVDTRGEGKTICPSEVSRHLAGPDEKRWRRLMKPVRAAAIRLADQGEVRITRKGKPVDPHDFRGVYRIGKSGD